MLGGIIEGIIGGIIQGSIGWIGAFSGGSEEYPEEDYGDYYGETYE